MPPGVSTTRFSCSSAPAESTKRSVVAGSDRPDKEGNEISLLDVMENDTNSVVDEVELRMQIKNMYKKMKEVLKNRRRLSLNSGMAFVTGNAGPARNSENTGYIQVLRFQD